MLAKDKFIAIDFYEKFISILICLPFALYLQVQHAMSFEALGVIYLAAGYGHFALAHLYQAKAGKVTMKMFGIYFTVALLLYYAVFNLTTPFLLIVVSTTFLHVFIDEIHLSRQKTNLVRYMLAVVLTIFLALFFVDYYFNKIEFFTLYLFMAGLFGALYIYNAVANKIGPYEVVILLYGASITGLILFTDIHPIKIFIFVVLMHYMNWYVRMFNKTKSVNKKLNLIYLRDIFVVHAIIFSAIFASTLLPEGNFLKLYFFDFKTGFVWVMLHNIFTLRPSDYRNMWAQIKSAPSVLKN